MSMSAAMSIVFLATFKNNSTKFAVFHFRMSVKRELIRLKCY